MSLTFKVADSLLYFAKARSECWKLTMVRINCYYKKINDEDQYETGNKGGGKGTDRDRDRDKYRVQIQKTNTNIKDKQTNTFIQWSESAAASGYSPGESSEINMARMQDVRCTLACTA